jgi:hypothetical protein
MTDMFMFDEHNEFLDETGEVIDGFIELDMDGYAEIADMLLENSEDFEGWL